MTPLSDGRDERLLEMLQQLLMIQTLELRPALTQASTLIADALGADKVDVFLHEATSDSLVALGTSETEMGVQQHRAGLNRQPVANNGPLIGVFRSGVPYRNGRVDEDPSQLLGMTRRLGVHSELDVPLDVQGERRGVVQAACRQADFFTERDLSFLASISSWIGIVTHRSELFERATAELRREGRREAAAELTRITRREREVASLIAEGLTNAEIAETLVLTEGTVANHLEHVLRKLRLRNRTQVATWAVEHGLYRTGDEDAAHEVRAPDHP